MVHLSRHTKFVIAGALGAAMVAGGLLAVVVQHPEAKSGLAPGHHTRATTVSAVTSTITIDSQIGETFAQAPAGATPALTAEQAWAQYAKLTGSSDATIPSDVTVQLGLLTLPVGPAGAPGSSSLITKNGVAYTALNELAYGYSWHSCPVSTLPNATLPPNPCVQWNFLDANNGQQIDDTWQH